MELSGTFKDIDFIGQEQIYTCVITNAKITKPGTIIKLINGVHEDGKRHDDVKGILFDRQIVEYFPKGLHKIFPNLTRLRIEKCGLKKIIRQGFAGIDGLIEVDLGDNLIESLPDNLFNGMKNLQYINFANNKITSASSKLLKPIKNQLKYADFRENTNKNIDVVYNLQDNSSIKFLELKQHLDKCDKPKKFSVDADPWVGSDFFESYQKKLEMMWTEKKYSDYTILVDEKEIKVHRNILVMQSSKFETKFDNEIGKTEDKIDGYVAEAVEEFLKFFYTAKHPSATNAIEVFKLASEYDVPKLMDLSEEIIIDNINESNVVEVTYISNMFKRNRMKNASTTFFKSLFPGRNYEDKVFDDPETMQKFIKFYNFEKSCCKKKTN